MQSKDWSDGSGPQYGPGVIASVIWLFEPSSVSLNLNVVAKKFMPIKLNTNIIKKRMHVKFHILDTVLAMAFTNTRKFVHFLASLKTRRRRNPRKAEAAPPPKLKSSRKLAPTMKPSNAVTSCVQYRLGPNPICKMRNS